MTTRSALFIVITDLPGGAERVTHNLAAELASRPGWTVEVMIVCKQAPHSFTKQALPPSVRVRYGPAANWFVAFPFLPFRLLFRSYDFVFSTQVYINALVSAMRRLRLFPVRAAIARESTSVFDRWSGLKGRMFAWLYSRYGSEDRLIAQTAYMAEHIRPWLPQRAVAHTQVMPNPVDADRIAALAAAPLDSALRERLAASPNLLYCGRLIETKRPLAAIEVLNAVLAAGHRLQLVFIGAGNLEESLRAETRRRGLDDKIVFLGQMMNPYAAMAACQYGIVPSLREGFPNVALEMMACGFRKIVVTPCAGDLHLLPEVAVTQTFEAQEAADVLVRAIAMGEDHGPAYRAAIAERSVGRYLDALLDVA
jgi:glycosyltransferase involved in cell wall biosynthesis